MAGKAATKPSTETKKTHAAEEQVEKTSIATAEELLEKINATTAEVKADGVNDTVRKTSAPKIAMDEEIPCRSIVFGGLTWVSPKTGAHYRWNGIGDIEYIPFGELATMNNSSRSFLFRPLFVIQDARVVEHFRLLPTYEKVARIGEIDRAITKDPSQIEPIIEDGLRVGMRGVLISKIRELRKSGILSNIDVIRMLEKKLAYDFEKDSPTEDEE